MDINLNNVQHEPIIVTGSFTASLNRYYVNTANATYTDPTPVQGEGFIVYVKSGTATIGGTGYSTSGSLVFRYYHSGAWANTVLVDPSGSYQPLDADLTSIASLTSTSAYLRRSAANTYVLDSYSTVGTNIPATSVTGKLLTGGTFVNGYLYDATSTILEALEVLDQYAAFFGYTSVPEGSILLGDGAGVLNQAQLTLSATGGAFALDGAGVLTMPNADTSTRGLLTSTDWNTFNNKLSSGDIFFNHISGLWNAPMSAGAINSGTSFDGRSYFMPIVVSKTTTFTAIGVPISVGVAASTCRLALYNSSSSTGEPTTIVYETATLDTSSNGFKSENFSSNKTLTPGLYWLAFQTSSASVGVRFSTGVIIRPNPANSVSQTNYSEVKAYGAFTSNPTVTFTNNTNSVMVMLKAL